MKHMVILLCWIGFLTLTTSSTSAQEESAKLQPHVVLPGDSWAALAARYRLPVDELRGQAGHFNQQREPSIGSVIQIPTLDDPDAGKLMRPMAGGVLSIALKYQMSPWSVAIRNGLHSPYRPLLYTPLFLPLGTALPKELPQPFETMELSHLVARPGMALAIRARVTTPVEPQISLNDIQFNSFSDGNHLVGLVGTGAFYGSGEPELTIRIAGTPLWSQPWRFQDIEWSFQQITLTGQAAAIDQESIARERARLFEIWSLTSPAPAWERPFKLPLEDYLDISSQYGARRSYNGGPYSTYHEGVDFSSYGGTAVYAPAGGTVALADLLYVRGGAVIIDHGLGIYSGYYHLSELMVATGQLVQAGEKLGEVGTTGLSTGNHLHWDLLVSGTWVDAGAWIDSAMGCWILEGFGRPCNDPF